MIDGDFFSNLASGWKLSLMFFYKYCIALFCSEMYYIFNCRVVIDHISIETYFIHSSNFPPRYAFNEAFMIGLTYSGAGKKEEQERDCRLSWKAGGANNDL